jgi:hypothetical protein
VVTLPQGLDAEARDQRFVMPKAVSAGPPNSPR